MKNKKPNKLFVMFNVIFIALLFVVIFALVFNFTSNKTLAEIIQDRLFYQEVKTLAVKFNEPLNYTFDLRKVVINENGASLKKTNSMADIILLDDIDLAQDTKFVGFRQDAIVYGTSTVKYQITSDGEKWYYYNGAKWDEANSCLGCANTAKEVSENIGKFPVSKKFQIKVIMTSDNLNKPVLKKVELDYYGEDINKKFVEKQERLASLFVAFAKPPTIVCGNGIVEEGEDCDDGNNNNNDYCSNQCENRTPICHATGSESHPYNLLWVADDAIDGEGENDHTNHPDDIIPITDLNGDGQITEEDCSYGQEPNEPPVAIDDSATTPVNTPVVIDVPANDSDPDGNLDTSTVTIDTPPVHGTVTNINATTGEATYEPDTDYVGSDSFIYEICDTEGLCDTATVTITIEAGQIENQPPIAVNDFESTMKNTSVIVNVPGNDSDPDGNLDLTSVTIDTPPANGTIDFINPTTGATTYTPNTDYLGTDTYVYEICDTDDLCDTATVTITITENPYEPECGNGIVEQGEDCDDANNNNNDFCSNQCENRTPICHATGSETHPYNLLWVADDAIDGEGENDHTNHPNDIIPITDRNGDGEITEDDCSYEANNPPVAIDDFASTLLNTSVIIDILANDSDPDGNLDPSTVFILDSPDHGAVTDINITTGEVTYEPDTGFTGVDTFEYQVCDTDGLCDSALVTVYVNMPEMPPVALDDTAETLINTPVDIDILANDSDPDGTLDPSTVLIITPPINGTITNIDGTTGIVTYEPDTAFFGIDTFEYQVCDDDALCDTALVTVTVLSPPTANDDAAVTSINTPVDIDVLDNDIDPDGILDPTTVSIITPPTNGTITNINTTNGVITYEPDTDYTGMDTFEYQVCDNDGLCDSAVVTIGIEAELMPPVANDDSATTVINNPIIIDILDNDSDVDGTLDPNSVTIITNPTSGSITNINTLTGAVTYQPNTNFVGVDTFEYQVCDNDYLCDTAIVTVTVRGGGGGGEKYPPVANDDAAVTNTSTPVIIDILANDYDTDGYLNVSSIIIISGPTSGSVTDINTTNGAVTYNPSPGYIGTDSFVYRVCDNDGMCDTATVTITIGTLGTTLAPPVANDDFATTDVNTAVNIDILANDSDPDGALDPSSINITLLPVNGTVTNINLTTGIVTYMPDLGFTGTDDFEYEVCDNDSLCDTAVVTVTVLPGLIPPVAIDDVATTTIDTPVTIGIMGNDYDLDGYLIESSISIITFPANGVVSDSPIDGAVIYTPNLGYLGADTFEYEICDNDNLCDTALVSITVSLLPVVPPVTPLVVPAEVIPVAAVGPITTTIGINDLYCGVIYETPNIVMVGSLTATPGTALSLEYTFNGGQSWNPIGQVTGLETGAGIFNIQMVDLQAGNYSLIVRATFPDGTSVTSLECPFSVQTPLVMGSNQFLVNIQSSPASMDGVVQFKVNEPQIFHLEAEGALYASVRNLNTGAEYPLTYDNGLKLWVGTISFSQPGFYRLEAFISNNTDSYSREINSVLVIEDASIVNSATGEAVNAQITIYEQDPATGDFIAWNASAYGQTNPLNVAGNFSILLPEGNFYLEVIAEGYAPATSLITTLETNSSVTANIRLQPQGGIIDQFIAPASPTDVSNNFPLQVTAVPESQLLEIGQQLPDVTLYSVEGAEFQLFDQLRNKPIILFVYNTWNTSAQEQMDLYNQVVDEIGNKYDFYPISTIEPFNVTVKQNKRGNYDINDYKPDDAFYEDYKIITSPQFFVINPDETLKGSIVGPMQAETLANQLLNIIEE